MKKLSLFNCIVLLLAITITSCGPSMNASWDKPNYSARNYRSIAVIAISDNLSVRQNMEAAIIEDIRRINPNIACVSGISLFPPNMDNKKLTEAYIESELEAAGVDAVLTASIVNSYISNELVQGTPSYAPIYYNAGGYIYRTYDYMYSPDYYQQSQNFVLQSTLFDLKEGSSEEDKMVWRGESEVSDPSSITDGAYRYANNLTKYLEKQGFLN